MKILKFEMHVPESLSKELCEELSEYVGQAIKKATAEFSEKHDLGMSCFTGGEFPEFLKDFLEFLVQKMDKKEEKKKGK